MTVDEIIELAQRAAASETSEATDALMEAAITYAEEHKPLLGHNITEAETEAAVRAATQGEALPGMTVAQAYIWAVSYVAQRCDTEDLFGEPRWMRYTNAWVSAFRKVR